MIIRYSIKLIYAVNGKIIINSSILIYLLDTVMLPADFSPVFEDLFHLLPGQLIAGS